MSPRSRMLADLELVMNSLPEGGGPMSQSRTRVGVKQMPMDTPHRKRGSVRWLERARKRPVSLPADVRSG